MVIALLFLQTAFSVLILGLLVFFFFVFLSTWALAQYESEESRLHFREVVSLAAIEWGSHIMLLASQLGGLNPFHEAPPIRSQSGALNSHLPILLVPSLHCNSGIFRALRWRLIKHSFSSLWPFDFKPFLKNRALLKDDLREFIRGVLAKTEAKEFRLISFGTSYPLVAEILAEAEFKTSCLSWISISSPVAVSKTMRFLMTSRIREVYSKKTEKLAERTPDFLIRGRYDSYCYPAGKIFPKATEGEIVIEPLGHYGVVLHPKTIQSILGIFKDRSNFLSTRAQNG